MVYNQAFNIKKSERCRFNFYKQKKKKYLTVMRLIEPFILKVI